eukprot:6458732-Pyramimonas_sp.AAC.1
MLKEHILRRMPIIGIGNTFDSTGKRKDHAPVSAYFKGQISAQDPGAKRTKKLDQVKLADPAMRVACAAALGQIELPPWSTDVNQHYHEMQMAVQECIAELFRQGRFTPSKPTLDPQCAPPGPGD